MKLINKIEKKAFQKYKTLVQRIFPSSIKPHRHIFVVGVQRSGTNMVMEIFDRSLECTVFHDYNPLAYDDYIQRDIQTIKKLSDAAKSEFVIFKPMTELHKLDFFLDKMAPAQGIWLYRKVEDVVNSHLKLWTSTPDFLKEFVKNRATINWRGGGVSDENYTILQEFVTDDLNNANAVALFWFYRNAQFFEKRHFMNPNIHIINYDDYVLNPQKHFKILIENLELKYRPYMIRHIHTHSIHKEDPPCIDKPILHICRKLERKFQNFFDRDK